MDDASTPSAGAPTDGRAKDDHPEVLSDGSATVEPPPLRQGLEALLFLADEPMDAATLADALQVSEPVVEEHVAQLMADYLAQHRGMEIRRAAGGWRMYSADAARPVLERWALVGRSGRLTQAALETLAVIAYKQPIGRQEIGDIRGVNADGAVRSLIARGYVQEVGRDPGPGQAVLYGTTTTFLERLGLDALGDLPPLTDYLPEAPAPDEPALGALKEIRRRLASGEDLMTGGSSTRSGSPREPASSAATDAGLIDSRDDEDEDDEQLPPPQPSVRDDTDIDELTDRLEKAARSAVDRLRQAVASDGTSGKRHGADGDLDLDETANLDGSADEDPVTRNG